MSGNESVGVDQASFFNERLRLIGDRLAVCFAFLGSHSELRRHLVLVNAKHGHTKRAGEWI
jgi:hypothetical protein